MTATLELLRHKGFREDNLEVYYGRQTDERVNVNKDNTGLKLEYLDEFGRKLTPKEAFRQLSHRFHGKKPGKNKTEKRLRQFLEEKKRKEASSTEGATHAVRVMNKELSKAESPYIVLGRTSTGSMGGAVDGFSATDVQDLSLRKGAHQKVRYSTSSAASLSSNLKDFRLNSHSQDTKKKNP
jgi:U4/U6.U5 tri-snRNP-associated protein 1